MPHNFSSYLFSPGIALMSRLSFHKKFAILVLIVGIAFSVTLYSLYVNLNQTISNAQHEIEGIALIKPIVESIQLVQQHRGLSSGVLGGINELESMRAAKNIDAEQAFISLEARLPVNIKQLESWASIAGNWKGIQTSGLQWSKEDNFSIHTQLISKMLVFSTDIADDYGLTTDAELDTFYLAHTLTNELLEALEQLGRVRAFGTGILGEKHISEPQKILINTLIEQLKETLYTLKISIEKAVRYNPKIQGVLISTNENIQKLAQQVIDEVHSDILSEHLTMDPKDFFSVTTTAINEGYSQIYQTMLPTVDGLLQGRILNTKTELLTIFGIAFLFLLLLAYLMEAIYKNTVDNIQQLSRAVGNFAHGNLTERVHLKTHDELQQIGDSFNTMADEMVDLFDSQKATETELRVAATAFESQEGMVITDINNVIIKVNQAFIRLTGYSSEELINRKMKLLKSGQHDAEFYAAMWDSIIRTGTWQGEIWNRLKNGEVHPQFVTITAVKNNDGDILNYIANYTDITERKVTEEKINNLAFYDPLTQLPNRVLLADRMQQTMAHCCRSREIAAVCMLDLDGFKQVNDTLGHASGDQLLRDVAQRLQECIRQEDTAARFGGDEFALLLGGFSNVSECEQTLARIVASLSAPYQIFGQMARISASIGVTLFPDDSSDADLLLRHADEVMYEVKKTSKNGYKLFNSIHARRNQTNQDFRRKIGIALCKEQFELYYQPKVDCRKGQVVGVEALVRWNHPVLGLLLPSEFIPLIEYDDLIIDLGEWTIQQTLRQLQDWHEAGIGIQISVNISARQLHNQEFPQRLQALLSGYDAEIIKRLEIEIVETAALEDVITGGDAIRKCHTMGVHVALDDFGVGFSSLAHLKHLAADALKIDLSFISGMLKDEGDMAIVEGVIGLAASFRLEVVAEGVEYVDQILMLLELGCDLMQGYGLAKPMPAKQIPAWLAAFTPDPLWGLSSSKIISRDYFELLLAEVNHRYWTDGVINHLGDLCEQTSQESLLNHRLCRFGQWFCDQSTSYFRGISELQALDEVHQNIHQTAANLVGHHQAGMAVEADAEKARLLDLQGAMTSLLHRLRIMLADELLK